MPASVGGFAFLGLALKLDFTQAQPWRQRLRRGLEGAGTMPKRPSDLLAVTLPLGILPPPATQNPRRASSRMTGRSTYIHALRAQAGTHGIPSQRPARHTAYPGQISARQTGPGVTVSPC